MLPESPDPRDRVTTDIGSGNTAQPTADEQPGLESVRAPDSANESVTRTIHPSGGGNPAALASTDFLVADELYNTELVYGDPAPYRLEGQVTRGAMGSIFKGRDTAFGRDIALKVLAQQHQHDPGMRQRFLNEIRITGKLQHPGVVPVYALGEFADGRPFFTMRYLRGRTLAELLAERTGPADNLAHFLKIFEQVCQVLGYAHSLGVIHRDLKPANVMVGEFGVVKVVDWGLAKVMGEADEQSAADTEPAATGREVFNGQPSSEPGEAPLHTQVGTVIGSPAYISPEQARGEVDRLDARTDVFGLGAILCEILTGHPVHLGSRCTEVCRKAAHADVTETFTRLTSCGADTPLIELAKRCLAPDQADRPQDAGVVVAELMAYLAYVLRQPERDLVRFFELSLDLFCIAGFDGFFHRVNENFSRVLGYTVQELVSRPFLEFVHPDDQQKTLDAMLQLAQGTPLAQFRNRYRDARGRYRWFEWTAKSVPEERLIFAAARDVTAQTVLPPAEASGRRAISPGQPASLD
jgi:serine/threonine-protein kinase